jgi:hypothetical protein
MKHNLKNAIVMLLTLASTSHASLSIQAGETGLLMWFFLAFVGLIITIQLVPGAILFSSMVKGIFANHNKAF